MNRQKIDTKIEKFWQDLNGGYTSVNSDTCFNFNVYLNMFIIKCQGKKEGKRSSATTRIIAMVVQNDFDTANGG